MNDEFINNNGCVVYWKESKISDDSSHSLLRVWFKIHTLLENILGRTLTDA